MHTLEAMTYLYEQVAEEVRRAVDGLDAEALRWRPDADANPIGWLVWHLTRVQDDHVAAIADREQVWRDGAWAPRFGLAEGDDDTGYGHTRAQVARVRPESADVLVRYHEAALERTKAHLRGREPADLDRVVDRGFDPPVTEGVRLSSVLLDSLQHVGQAAYVRGLWERR